MSPMSPMGSGSSTLLSDCNADSRIKVARVKHKQSTQEMLGRAFEAFIDLCETQMLDGNVFWSDFRQVSSVLIAIES